MKTERRKKQERKKEERRRKKKERKLLLLMGEKNEIKYNKIPGNSLNWLFSNPISGNA